MLKLSGYTTTTWLLYNLEIAHFDIHMLNRLVLRSVTVNSPSILSQANNVVHTACVSHPRMREVKVVLAERGLMVSYTAWQTPARQGAMVHRTLPDPAENQMLSLLEMPILVSELRSRDHGVDAFGGRKPGCFGAGMQPSTFRD